MGGCCHREEDAKLGDPKLDKKPENRLSVSQSQHLSRESSIKPTPSPLLTAKERIRKSKTSTLSEPSSAKRNLSTRTQSSSKKHRLKGSHSLDSVNFPTKTLNQPIEEIYEVKEEAIQDSFGTISVIRHRKTGLNRLVRIVEKSGSGGNSVANLITEMSILSKIDHPNIIRPFSTLEDDRKYYLLYRPIRGGKLAPYTQVAGKLPELEIASIIMQLLQALKHCHSLGIVHKNISIKNIIFVESKEGKFVIRLTGIGANRPLVPEKSLSPSGLTAYYAPESFRGVFNESTDVWACGVLLYFLATNSLPFSIASKEDLRYDMEHSTLKFPLFVWGGFSTGIQDMIGEMLRIIPTERVTLQGCLKHTWVKNSFFTYAESIVTEMLTNMRLFKGGTKLKIAILRFLSVQSLSSHERSQAVTAFNALTTDGDDKISSSELQAAFTQHFPEKEAQAITNRVMDSLDDDRSGSISCGEFLIAAFGEKLLLTDEHLQVAFEMIDQDTSGFIRLDELTTALAFKATDKDWVALLKNEDRDGDSQLDFNEFVRLIHMAMLQKE